MSATHRGWPRTLLIGAAWLAAGVVLCASPGAVGGAAATRAHAATRLSVTHPQDDVAGSTIALHEASSTKTGEPGSTGTNRIGRDTNSALGLDVSSHQGNVDWGAVAANGARFAYVKASEGTGYLNPAFNQQYDGALNAGLVHGAYTFALPDQSDGATQADYFVDHGGRWTADGSTLPPALDIEYNPYGDQCYGLSPAAMSGWIKDFTRTVLARTSRYPAIYTSTKWWAQCTGNDNSFGSAPLWLPHYGSSIGELPAGWAYQTIWQYANSGPFPGDQNTFNGTIAQLRLVARG